MLSACGTPMPLDGKTRTLDLSRTSIALLTLEQTRAQDRTMPWPRQLYVLSEETKKIQAVAVDVTFMDYGEDDRHYRTPLRLALPPGKYKLLNILCDVSAFPLKGTVIVPLWLEFEVPAQSVVYLGRISAHMRPRTDEEFRAGPLIPLIAQAALGISTSTFDIAVSDQSAVDIPRFQEAFPVLRGLALPTRLLPGFDRRPWDASYVEQAKSTPQPIQPQSP